MMKVFLHRNFEKNFRKLSFSQKEKTRARLKLFVADPFDPILGNHALTGKYLGCRSINATGDLRAIYKPIADDACLFITIGTHSALYGL